MTKPELIQKRIEGARTKLYMMERQYGGLLHPNVIEQSMRLDELINKYNRNVYSCYSCYSGYSSYRKPIA